MLKFFPNIQHTAHYPTARIAKIGKAVKYSNSDSFYYSVELIDGGTVNVDQSIFDTVTEAARTIVPAVPGFFVIHTGEFEGAGWVTREPIIAWSVGGDDFVTPVTPRGLNDGMYRAVPFVMPDDRVLDPDQDCTHDSIADYVAAERGREARRTLSVADDASAAPAGAAS